MFLVKTLTAQFHSIVTILTLSLLCSASSFAGQLAVRVMSEVEMTKSFNLKTISAVIGNRAKVMEKNPSLLNYFPESETKLVGIEVKYSGLVVSQLKSHPYAYLEVVKGIKDPVQNAVLTVKMILAPAGSMMFAAHDLKMKDISSAEVRGLVLASKFELTTVDGKNIMNKLEMPYFQNGNISLLNQVSGGAGQFKTRLPLAKFDSTGLINTSDDEGFLSYNPRITPSFLSYMTRMSIENNKSFEANVRAVKFNPSANGWAPTSTKVNARLKVSTDGLCAMTGRTDILCLSSYDGSELLKFVESSMEYVVGSNGATSQDSQTQNGGIDVKVTPIKDGVSVGVSW